MLICLCLCGWGAMQPLPCGVLCVLRVHIGLCVFVWVWGGQIISRLHPHSCALDRNFTTTLRSSVGCTVLGLHAAPPPGTPHNYRTGVPCARSPAPRRWVTVPQPEFHFTTQHQLGWGWGFQITHLSPSDLPTHQPPAPSSDWANFCSGPRPIKNHLEERLLDQAQVQASYTPLFGGHLRSIPQGMILDVQPLVKSLFCRIRQFPNGFFDSEASIP